MKYTFTVTFLTLCFLTGSGLFAQEDYQKWQQKEQQKLNKYIEEQDAQFVDFLKKEWKQTDVEKGIKPFDKPKPKTPPVIKEQPEKIIEEKKNPQTEIPPKEIEITKPEKEIEKSSDSGKKPEDKSETTISKKDDIQFNLPLPKKGLHKLQFFSLTLPVSYNNSLNVNVTGNIDNQSIAAYWKDISSSDYKDCLIQTQALRNKIKLNDWGYAKLLFDIGKQINNGKRNEGYLFTWYMLVKSGYKVRVGYEDNNVYLLIPSMHRLFGVPFFSFQGNDYKFYVLSFDNNEKLLNSLYTYNEDYPNLTNIFDFNVKELPDLGNKIEKKEFIFKYKGAEHKIAVQYNKPLIQYFEYYPYTNLEVYFHTLLSANAEKTILSSLKPVIKDMNEPDAVNFLLRFVQYATGYKVDSDQFGREKPLFAEESLFYSYSDCEDRSIFFSYLIKKLLKLDVVGLDYPDHIATAVKFNSSFNGDFVTYKNNRYIICDPTYIGAAAGTAMPTYKGVEPKIIDIQN